jgi:hypothetical protein
MKTIKCFLKSALTQEGRFLLEKVTEVVPVMTTLVTEAQHLIGLHVRRLLEEGKEVPPFNQMLVLEFVYLVRQSKPGKKQKRGVDYEELRETKTRWNELCQSAKRPIELTNGKQLGQVEKYAATQVATNFNNNIWMHFYTRVTKFVALKNPNLPSKDVRKLVGKIWEKGESDEWPWLLPKNIPTPSHSDGTNKAYAINCELREHPERFLPSMWLILKALEDHNRDNPDKLKKTFALVPTHRGFQDLSITIDSETLRQWLPPSEVRWVFQKKKKSKSDF